MTRLLAAIGLVAGVVPGGAAQTAAYPLGFMELRPAMTRGAADEVIRRHGGTLQCRPTRERRIEACDARIADSAGPVTVTLSLVDGRIGIALLSAPLPAERIADWHAALTGRYGDAPTRRRPGEESFQWIRAGQMLRLTVRRESAGLIASVSLVDGALLDGLPPP